MFESGLEFLRADFHLHTQKDKEFSYSGEPNDFVKSYISALKQANISVGVITNHNKFDKDEYKALKRAASKEKIFILPGVELTVKEGANGIHTLIVFNPDEWLENGNNHIQTFLTAAFATISNPENRNTKCCYDLKSTLEKLEEYGKDYFVIFAHVDQGSGLFNECGGGLLESLSGLAPFRKRVLGIQKSRTRDNINKFNRCFGYIPALIEGSDPKSLKDIGKGDKQTYLKIGEYSYAAIKFALQDYKSRVAESLPERRHVVEMLSKKIDGLSDEFAEIKREIKDDTLDIDGFVKMTEELEKYKENLKQLDERAKSKKQIESAFKKAMRERNDILLEQFNAYKLEIQKINESQNELKITIDFKGDRDNFKSQMKTDFRGSGISEIKYQYLCDTFRDYVELIEDWILCDGMKIKEIISSSEYTKLDKKLQDQYADLLKNQVSNNVEIYYHDKLLRHHSIGQRASALILFILMQSDNDIILIDQPEDDLDNKIIYDEVITAIAKKKQDIQFIFATHNANIPVLGDAERIFVVEYQDTTIDISQGNIDLKSTHKQIVDIMEGGEEAFDKRQLIYTSWK